MPDESWIDAYTTSGTLREFSRRPEKDQLRRQLLFRLLRVCLLSALRALARTFRSGYIVSVVLVLLHSIQKNTATASNMQHIFNV